MEGSPGDQGFNRRNDSVAKKQEGVHGNSDSHDQGNQASRAWCRSFVIESVSVSTFNSAQGDGCPGYFGLSGKCEVQVKYKDCVCDGSDGMRVVCCVYGSDVQPLTGSYELEAVNSLFGNVDLVLTNPSQWS